MTGKWFSIATKRGEEVVEVSPREYTEFDENGVATRMDTMDHSYATEVDRWGEEYEYVTASWPVPSIRFDLPCGTYSHIAVSSTVDGEIEQLIPMGPQLLSSFGSLAISPTAELSGDNGKKQP